VRRCGALTSQAFRIWCPHFFMLSGQNRRMSKDYERVPETAEAFMYVAMTRLMVRRLARP